MQELEEAFTLFDKGEYTRAEEIYLNYLERSNNRNDDSYKAALHGLGYVKCFQGQFQEARDCYHELLELSIEQADRKDEAATLHQLGMVQRMAGDHQKALQFFDAEYNIWFSEFPEFHVGFSANFYEKGMIALERKIYGEAMGFFDESLKQAKLADDLVAVGCAYRGLGEVFVAKSEKEQAIGYFQRAYSAFDEAGDGEGMREVQRKLDLIDRK